MASGSIEITSFQSTSFTSSIVLYYVAAWAKVNLSIDNIWVGANARNYHLKQISRGGLSTALLRKLPAAALTAAFTATAAAATASITVVILIIIAIIIAPAAATTIIEVAIIIPESATSTAAAK